MTTLTLPAYAKINLTLDVFSKRADGYHSLASVMQTISLCDSLSFARSGTPGITLTCESAEDISVPMDESNLVYRAAQAALQAAERRELGVAIHLVKRVPAQAGLGGGSSDAATTLRGVNALLELGLEEKALHSLAASLGSDAPFFLLGGAAAARGRGENLIPLPDITPFWMVVVKPEVGVSTAWAYHTLDAIPERVSHRATKRMEEAIQNGDSDRVLAFQCNDFELPVFAHHPKIAWLHDELRMAGASSAHLCGSGSALYGVAPDEATATKIAAYFHGRYPHVTIASAISRRLFSRKVPHL